MFPHRYFPSAYFAQRYFPQASTSVVVAGVPGTITLDDSARFSIFVQEELLQTATPSDDANGTVTTGDSQ